MGQSDDKKEDGKLPKWLIPYVIGGQGLDTGTTVGALRKGYRESNPLLPKNPAGIIATKAATTGAAIYGIKKLEKKHPKLAKGLGIAVGSSGIIPSLINLYRMNKDKR